MFILSFDAWGMWEMHKKFGQNTLREETTWKT